MKNKKDEISVKFIKVINSIALTITSMFGILFGVNLGDSFVDDSVNVITPMLCFMIFGVIALITRSNE